MVGTNVPEQFPLAEPPVWLPVGAEVVHVEMTGEVRAAMDPENVQVWE